MRDENEEAKLPRPDVRIAAERCSEWLPRPPHRRARHRSHARGDVEPSPASRAGGVATDRSGTSGEWVTVLENRKMSKQPPTKTPEENPRDPHAPGRLDVPHEFLREEFEWSITQTPRKSPTDTNTACERAG